MATRLALRIRDRLEGLTPSEQKLATLLLERPPAGADASHTSVLSMLYLIANAVAGRLGILAQQRRDLITDLREELEGSE